MEKKIACFCSGNEKIYPEYSKMPEELKKSSQKFDVGNFLDVFKGQPLELQIEGIHYLAANESVDISYLPLNDEVDVRDVFFFILENYNPCKIS